MKYLRKAISLRVGRFAIVGFGNTALNFLILNFAFYGLHRTKLTSIFIATTCAVIFSFVLNRNFVFRDKARPARKLAYFIIVTVSGVMLVQNTVYALGLALLSGNEIGVSNAIHTFSGVRLNGDFIDVNLSNVVASLCVMIWNYNGYRLFVFNSSRHGSGGIENVSEETA